MPYKRFGQWYNNNGELIRSPSRYFDAVDRNQREAADSDGDVEAKIAKYEANEAARAAEEYCAHLDGFKSAKSKQSYEDAMFLYGDMDMWDDSE